MRNIVFFLTLALVSCAPGDRSDKDETLSLIEKMIDEIPGSIDFEHNKRSLIEKGDKAVGAVINLSYEDDPSSKIVSARILSSMDNEQAIYRSIELLNDSLTMPHVLAGFSERKEKNMGICHALSDIVTYSKKDKITLLVAKCRSCEDNIIYLQELIDLYNDKEYEGFKVRLAYQINLLINEKVVQLNSDSIRNLKQKITDPL